MPFLGVGFSVAKSRLFIAVAALLIAVAVFRVQIGICIIQSVKQVQF